MRFVGAVGCVCLLAAPLQGEPVTYTFNVANGSLTWLATGSPSTSGGLTGTFAVTVYQSDGLLGESDTFLLEDACLVNQDALAVSVIGLATAYMDVGSGRLLDFLPVGPGHIGPGGQGAVDSEVFAQWTVIHTGAFQSTFMAARWSDGPGPFNLGFGTSVGQSDVLTASLAGTYVFQIAMWDIGATITWDFIIDVTGTAHVVPDPALGGLTLLGLGGAGVWLRRRRNGRDG